jgi:hypothetical protein
MASTQNMELFEDDSPSDAPVPRGAKRGNPLSVPFTAVPAVSRSGCRGRGGSGWKKWTSNKIRRENALARLSSDDADERSFGWTGTV